MDKNPFSLFEFLGYFIPGALFHNLGIDGVFNAEQADNIFNIIEHFNQSRAN